MDILARVFFGINGRPYCLKPTRNLHPLTYKQKGYNALDFLRDGDSLVVWRLDRSGCSLKYLLETVALMEERGIGFRSLQEAIDTTTSDGRLIFHIFGALAEFERNMIHERTLAGLRGARARGRKGGRPKALDARKTELAYHLYDERKYTIKEICQMLGISKPTLYAYLRQRKGDTEEQDNLRV